MSKGLRYLAIGFGILFVASQLRQIADAILSSRLNAIVVAAIGVGLWLAHNRDKRQKRETVEFLERLEQQERLQKQRRETADERYSAYVIQCEGWCPPMSREEWDREEGLAPAAPSTSAIG